MKILFDHQRFGHQKYGGITRYFTQLAIALNSHPSVDAQIFAPLHVNGYLSQLRGKQAKGIRIPYARGIGFVLGVTNALLAKLVVKHRNDIDIFHETYYSNADCKPRSAARLLTVFDMTHERYPRLFAKFNRTASAKAMAVTRADHIICISESTRRDLIEILHLDESRTSVVHLAHNPLRLLTNSALPPSGRPFILFVGSRGGYKNFLQFLMAFSLSRPRRDGHRLICFGGGTLSREERAAIEAYGLSEADVVALDGPDEVLAGLYASATLFAYPSLYEGFGIPLLEAMSLGCPVVCSNTSAFPEVVGESAELFDPASVEAMAHSLEFVAYDRVRRNELILSGRNRALCFSWDRCANETLEVYRRVSGV